MQDSKRRFPQTRPDAEAPPEQDGDSELFPKFEGFERKKSRRSRRRIALIVFALIGLAGVITFVLHIGDVTAFANQVSRARPSWLLLAIGAQGFAFFFQSLVWWTVLRRLGQPRPLPDLFNLSIGKLFADQALPSAGLSGAFFIMLALTGRGVPREDAFVAFVFGAASFIAAFIIAVVASFAYLTFRDGAPAFLSDDEFALYLIGAIAAFVLLLMLIARIAQVRAWLARRGAVLKIAALAGPTAARIAAEMPLFLRFIVLQLAARAADGVTLWLAFRAIGETAPIEACFVGVSIASLAATLAPTPMGIGTFEFGLGASLSALGVSLESALTTTLLYRGLTLWMPLAFGFFIVQRELLRGRKKPPPEEAPEADPGGVG